MRFDTSIILIIPAVLLALFAQYAVMSTFSKYSKVRSSTGYTGKKLARTLLDNEGLSEVPIEAVAGVLTDHFDPRKNIVRLSTSTFNESSVAALGIVAHEIAHVVQLKEKYAPLLIRNVFVPVAQFGSSFSWIIFIVGILMATPMLIQIGIWLFIGVVAFSFLTLPVEFNASQRAVVLLQNQAFMLPDELKMAKKVLNAAAITYVASTLMAVMNLIRMVTLSKR